MKVGFSNPWKKPSGTYKTTDLILYPVKDEIWARSKPTPANPKTAEQLKIRGHVTLASRNWQLLGEAERAAWQRYADRYHGKDAYGRHVRTSGQATYIGVNCVRLILGLEMMGSAPSERPPVRLREITQVAVAASDEIAVQIHHDYRAVEGFQVIVRATPPLRSLRGTVPAASYRYVCGLGPGSAQALPPDGGTLLFSGVRSPVAEGQLYGIEARVVRLADGTVSTPVHGRFIKGR